MFCKGQTALTTPSYHHPTNQLLLSRCVGAGLAIHGALRIGKLGSRQRGTLLGETGGGMMMVTGVTGRLSIGWLKRGNRWTGGSSAGHPALGNGQRGQ